MSIAMAATAHRWRAASAVSRGRTCSAPHQNILAPMDQFAALRRRHAPAQIDPLRSQVIEPLHVREMPSRRQVFIAADSREQLNAKRFADDGAMRWLRGG